MARELALQMLPTQDPGMIAAALSMALDAPSSEEAGRVLDALGLARIQEVGSLATSPTADGIDELYEPSSGSEVEIGDGQSASDPPVDDETTTSSVGNEDGRAPSLRPPATLKKKAIATRLRSDVPSGESPSEPEPSSSGVDLEVGRRGVEFVMDYEERRGWDAREMAHHNPGYDVVSRGPNVEEIFI